jgi:uncharacterized RDD family membrane protein YckC
MVLDVAAVRPEVRTPSGLRRIAAFLIDYFLIAVYMGILFFVAFLLRRLNAFEISSPGGRQVLGVITLTLPVVLYFALSEASSRQGSIGKQATRLKVTDVLGKRIGIGRSLLRSGLKFLPWELAHTFVHRVPKSGDMPVEVTAALIGSFALAGIYLAGLFVGSRRPPYDQLAGTRVVESPTMR